MNNISLTKVVGGVAVVAGVSLMSIASWSIYDSVTRKDRDYSDLVF